MHKHAQRHTHKNRHTHKWMHAEWRDGTSPCVFTSPVILVNYACRGSLLGWWSGLGGNTHTHTHSPHHTYAKTVALHHHHRNHHNTPQHHAHQSSAHTLLDNPTTRSKITQTCRAPCPPLLTTTHTRVSHICL